MRQPRPPRPIPKCKPRPKFQSDKPSSVKVSDRITIGSGAFVGQEATVINIHSRYYSDFDANRDRELEIMQKTSGGISVHWQKNTGIIWFVRFDDKTTTTIIDDEIAEREK